MPKLWDDTIEAHRRSVTDAVLDATARLVAERGLASVTMSAIAEGSGIGRATLYRYFPDVEAILRAWHERRVDAHLDHLARVRDTAPPDERPAAVLTAYALLTHDSREHHGTDVAAALHRGDHLDRAHDRLARLVAEVLAEAAAAGRVRGDVPPAELARYCLHALSAVAALPSKAAVRRLVAVTLDGVRPRG